ncbi:MAG: tRNA pseudouridine(13) synthase TruD [Planctomycetia bacterium]
MGRVAGGRPRLAHGQRRCLPATGDRRDRERAAALRASPTGPLPGYDLRLCSGAPGALEREVLAAEGVDPEAFRQGLARMRGSRRPLRVPVREASLEVEGTGSIVVRFVLPPGAFATVLLGLLMDGATAPGCGTALVEAPGAPASPGGPSLLGEDEDGDLGPGILPEEA